MAFSACTLRHKLFKRIKEINVFLYGEHCCKMYVRAFKLILRQLWCLRSLILATYIYVTVYDSEFVLSSECDCKHALQYLQYMLLSLIVSRLSCAACSQKHTKLQRLPCATTLLSNKSAGGHPFTHQCNIGSHCG